IDYLERYKTLNNNRKDVHYFWSSWSLAKAYFAAGDVEKFNDWVKQIQSEHYTTDKIFQRQSEKELRVYRKHCNNPAVTPGPDTLKLKLKFSDTLKASEYRQQIK